jgi:peroxiredoxin
MRFASAFCLVVASASSPAGEFNQTLKIGDAAPAWKSLPGVDGKKHSLDDLKDKKFVVVVFTCNSCPVAVDYEDRIIAFAKKHEKDAALVAINVNKIPADSLPKMKERAAAKKFPYPYLFDETQEIAKKFGAVFTPEFFILDADRKIAYMGGMDDNSNPKLVKERDLEPALAALLKGEKPPKAETLARGCRIRYAKERR